MNNIVIVEDRLKRGISLAEQFESLAEQHPDWQICVLALCYFNANEKVAEKDIAAYGERQFKIRNVSLWNFDVIMDEYTDSQKENTIVIMDFFLDGDGSDGVPMRRVNIRYARRLDDQRKKKIWFYTGTGSDNTNILCKLVGEDRVLEVKEVGDNFLRLNLEEEKFKNALFANSKLEV